MLPRPLKISKSCDDCKARKVRCIAAEQSDSAICANCLRRGVPCHFSQHKRRLRRPNATPASTNPLVTPSDTPGHPRYGSSPPDRPWHSKLYIEHLLENRHASGRRRDANSLFKAHDQYVGSASLAVFSESRISSVSNRLGHTRLRELLETITTEINARMNRAGRSSGSTIRFNRPSSPVPLSEESCISYIQAYFEQVHPLYPFLNRKEFEEKALKPEVSKLVELNAPFSALYHSVLALGCQYCEGGAFDPGKGKAWKLFQIALGLFPEIIVPQQTLTSVQAVTAMCIFATNFSCIQIEEMLISEAARMAVSLRYHRASAQGEDGAVRDRTFWVIYTIEKTTSFAAGRSSVISDYDIGTPIPVTPEAVFNGYDFFLSCARLGRLMSQAYETLFSVTATMNSREQYRAAIDTVREDLERWRISIPEEFRPGEPFRVQNLLNNCTMTAALKTYFSYYSMLIALSRLALHIEADTPSPQQEDTKITLMHSARMIIQFTRYIDTEAYTHIWILGIMPLSALFILFDLVIHNPTHPETRNNLAFLDVAAGYFSRLEYATGGSLPSSLLSEFAHIARQYVRDVQSRLPGPLASATAAPNPAQEFTPLSPTSSLVTTGYPNQNHTAPTGNSATDALYYPSDDTGWISESDIPLGFDIRNFFDSVIPDFMSPREN